MFIHGSLLSFFVSFAQLPPTGSPQPIIGLRRTDITGNRKTEQPKSGI
jgi:hypothetical protein